jgi:hypothetical protein
VGGSTRNADAHSNDLGFVWFNNAYDYENLTDTTTGNWNVTQAVSDWYYNSQLWINTYQSAGFYEITAYSGYYSYWSFLGGAWVYSNTSTCADPFQNYHTCNKTTQPATTAYITLNLSSPGSSSQILRNKASRHELGHVFGLDHPINTCFGILMDDGGLCPSSPNYITAHDSADMNALY